MGTHRDRPAAAASSDGQSEDLAMNGSIIIRPFIPRIEPDPHGGWFVILGSFGWLFGSRNEALRASRELAQEVR
jgi:hypothetical protein